MNSVLSCKTQGEILPTLSIALQERYVLWTLPRKKYQNELANTTGEKKKMCVGARGKVREKTETTDISLKKKK